MGNYFQLDIYCWPILLEEYIFEEEEHIVSLQSKILLDNYYQEYNMFHSMKFLKDMSLADKHIFLHHNIPMAYSNLLDLDKCIKFHWNRN